MRILSIFCVAYLAALALFADQPKVTTSIFSTPDPNHFQTFPRIAVSTKTRQSLVVWEKHPGDHPGHSLQGRFLNPQGKPQGGVFTIVSGPNTYHPDIAYNSRRNEFVLVYGNEFTTFGVFLQRLSPQGKPAGAAMRISPAEDSMAGVNDERPNIVIDEITGNISVLWARNKISNSASNIVEGLYGAILTSSYSVLTNAILIRKSVRVQTIFLVQPVVTDLKSHPHDGRLLIAYYQVSPTSFTGTPHFEYYIASIDPTLSQIQSSNFLKVKSGVDSAGGIYVGFHFLPSGTGYVMYADNAGMRMRKLNATGKFAGPPQPVFQSPLNNTRFFSFAKTEYQGAAGFRQILIGIEDPSNVIGRRALWIQIQDENNKPTGALERVGLSDFSSAMISSSIPAPTASLSYRFAAVFEQGKEVLRPTNGEATGLVLLNVTLTLR